MFTEAKQITAQWSWGHVLDFRNSVFSHLSPTVWQLRRCHWSRGHMAVEKPDWIIIFYKLPKQNGLGAGNPHKSGQLNLKHFLCLPGALTSPTSPLSSPLLTSLTSPHLSFLFGIKRLFPRCLWRTWSNQLVLCERQRETSTLYGISPTPPFLKEEMERMWPLVEPRAGSRHSEAPRPLLCPWHVRSAHHSHSGNWSKDAGLRE